MESMPVEGEKRVFYSNAAQYWSQVPPTVDGMLGGFGFISHIDIQGSSQFLQSLFRLKLPPGKGRALDCGAGIGRITKNLLLNVFDKVDIVEQNPVFIRQARASLGSHKKIGSFFCSGLQDFIPEPNSYDVIWCQWVLGHLTDDDLVKFLQACRHGLKAHGFIVLKENVTSNDRLEKDEVDSSVTRTLGHLCRIVKHSGLQRIKQRRQEKLPSSLYPVYMIAARPVNHTNEEGTHDPSLVSDEDGPSTSVELNDQEPYNISGVAVNSRNVSSLCANEEELRSISETGIDHSIYTGATSSHCEQDYNSAPTT